MAVRTHAVPLDDAALAWLALALVPELLPRRAFALVERFGTPRAVLEAPAGALAAADVPPAVVASVGRASSRARAETLNLAAAGRTVAVLGTGIDRVYPKWHRELARAIAGQGALVSEFPCGSPPLQFHFPRRNRIISGLTRGTIVVEAADDSGSLITAGHALEQDRQVFAVPGPVGVPAHCGPNRLIQQGA